MKHNILGKVRIVELMKNDLSLPKLNYHYIATSFFDMSIVHGTKSWKIELIQKPLEKPLEKNFTGNFFEEHI